MRCCRVLAALQIDRPVHRVQRHDPARWLSGARVDRLLSYAKLVLLLGVEPVAVDCRLFDLSHDSDVLQIADGFTVLHQLVVGHVQSLEIRPPFRLVLAAVPVQQLAEQQAGLLRVRALLGILGNAFRQRFGQRRQPRFDFAERFRWRGCSRFGSRQFLAGARRESAAALFEPVTE
jgi:hypothetical protein